YTPYAGDIGAGAHGYEFLELRAKHAVTSYYMPGSEDVLQASGRKPGRQYIKNVELSPGNRPVAGRAATETLIEPETDGLAAFIVHRGAGVRELPVPPQTGTGRYYVVADGEMTYAGKVIDRWACVFLSPDAEPGRFEVGPSGADILVLDLGQG